MQIARLAAVLALACAAVGSEPSAVRGAAAQEVAREFTVHAKKYTFDPARIEVQQDNLVKITLASEDIAHSFTVDDYRISRRVGAGQTTVFEFRADRPGEFPIYCNLTADDR